MALAAAIILAIAGPVINPRVNSLSPAGPLVLVIDNGWASATDWERRVQTAEALIGDAENAELPVSTAFTADASHHASPGIPAAAPHKPPAPRPPPPAPERNGAGE